MLIRAGRFLWRKLGLHRDFVAYRAAERTPEAGNQLIYDRLLREEPLLVGRLGANEAAATANYLDLLQYEQLPHTSDKVLFQLRGGLAEWQPGIRTALTRNAGVFPDTPTALAAFGVAYLKAISQIDILAHWDVHRVEATITEHGSKPEKVPLRCLEPYYFKAPWSAALQGKRVLVIHPYKDSILKQYEKRNLIFENQNILPAFDLQVLRAVQSIAGTPTPYASWHEALLAMQEQIQARDFDIALIGAGAYGLPLAAYIRKLGRKAVLMGGATQILFGIRGKRWDTHPLISTLYNQHWTRPAETERPANFSQIEGGCYW